MQTGTAGKKERKKERKNYALGRELRKKRSLQASLPYTTPPGTAGSAAGQDTSKLRVAAAGQTQVTQYLLCGHGRLQVDEVIMSECGRRR